LIRAAEDFVPPGTIDLPNSSGLVGTVNKQTGETFTLMSLSPAAETQLVVDNHSALIRFTYRDFPTKNGTYEYRAAYYFGKAAPEEIEKLFAKLKGM